MSSKHTTPSLRSEVAGMLLDAPTPLAWLETHLAARFDEWTDGATASEIEPRWWIVAEILADDAAMLRGLHERIVTTDSVPAPAAATYLAGWIGGALADAVGFALATTGAGFVVGADRVRWRQHRDGWMDRVELGDPTVVVEASHRWAGQPGVEVVANRVDLHARTIGALVDVLTPVIDACHRLARVGKPGLWNEVADAVGMAVAFQVTLPVLPDVVDTLTAAARVPGVPWKARPDLRIVDSDLGPVYIAQKGGCCLAYTRPRDDGADEETDEPDEEHRSYRERFPEVPGQPHYCSTCTFRDWSDTEARQLFWLEREHAKHTADHDDEGDPR